MLYPSLLIHVTFPICYFLEQIITSYRIVKIYFKEHTFLKHANLCASCLWSDCNIRRNQARKHLPSSEVLKHRYSIKELFGTIKEGTIR